MFFVWVSWSSGLRCCLVWCPLGPAPCSLRCLLSSLSFLLVGMFAGDVFLSVSLSLSGAGETQTHFGFGLPLVSLHPGHDLPLRSVRHAPHLHPGSRPALFFFFLGGVRVGVSRVWFLLSGLSACVSVCCLCMSALHVRALIPRNFGGRETIISPLLVMIIAIFWGSG